MLRRDYILRQIENFAAVLSKIVGLTQQARWREAEAISSEEFQKLIGLSVDQILKLSDLQLLARIVEGESTLAVENKAFMLAALLKSHGDVMDADEKTAESRLLYLKALHLLLNTFGRNESYVRPDFVPTVEMMVSALGEERIPVETRVLLMQHYERLGNLAKAEDALFQIAEAAPHTPGLREFGEGFYDRLQGASEQQLLAGNLTRSEVATGRMEFVNGLDRLNQRHRTNS